ncbi:MAG: PQQ-dependent sugar dehydrogenase [Methylothermaceae bacterium]|nr:PQQ-dependent sugar dehydrogenase [Methylothermaceae bacterium]
MNAGNAVPQIKLLVVFALPALIAALSCAGPKAEQVIDTQTGKIQVRTLATGLEHPWGLAFLPDGRMLVTERPGRLRIVSRKGRLSEPLAGVPRVFAKGQGGLLDVALDPNFTSNRWVYLAYAEPGKGGASTAVARAKLSGDMLEDVRVIFRLQPKVGGGNHFGCRLVFAPDGNLFITLGERFKFDPAQDLSSHLGKIVRIHPEGSVPRDNPFVGQKGARPEIWSSGHRNVQGAAIHPESGALWAVEFGPAGGDELNLIEPGRNYGWPLVSWGRHYYGRDIPDPPTRPDLVPPIRHWTPVISPSGMTFYTRERFPAWRENLFIGGLSSEALVRLTLDGQRVKGEERIPMGVRIRHVRQGPDGAVYLLTDQANGAILRLTPGGTSQG